MITIAGMALERVKITRIVRWLALLMLLQSSVVQAQYNYTTNSGAITITKYTGADGSVTIPSIIDNLPVTSIGERAFEFCYSLTIVVEACTNLTNPEWLAVETITLTNGASYFSDPQWANHRGRFYRIRSP